MENPFSISFWDRHVITGQEGQPQLLYVDQHYIHEVTSPQAFDGLREAGRQSPSARLTFGTFDHNVPTVNIYDIRDVISKAQMDALARNVAEFGIPHAPHGSANQGIVHMVGPDSLDPSQGNSSSVEIVIRQPTEHSAPLPWNWYNEVKHVFATQNVVASQTQKALSTVYRYSRKKGICSKDYVLALIAKYGVALGVGYVVEYVGEAIDALTMEERMTICNMSIEFGSKMGIMTPDQITFDYLADKEKRPKDFEGSGS